MYVEDDFSKFKKHIGKLISAQWSKIKNSSSSSQSERNIDQQLEEEYETLIREIDYLTAEKSCYLSFLNDKFHKSQSSADLSAILKKHSSEVLKNYLTRHDKEVKNDIFNNRQDLISYVTEVVVSRNKICNNKLCSCKPIKVSIEVLTDSCYPQENRKEIQSSDTSSEKAINVKPIIAEQANQTKSNLGLQNVAVTVQTDDWSHDPFCKCGCCPKTGSEIDNKSLITDEKPVEDATTSVRKFTASKNTSANCVGENVSANTSNRLCVPSNLAKLLENKESNQKFSTCNEKKDCACDAYDVQGALQRGIVLPSSDICIQKKKVNILDGSNDESKKGKEKSTKKDKKRKFDSSDDNETTDTTSSSDNKNKKKKENKKDKVEKKKDKEEKKQKESDSSNSTPREKSKKERGGLSSCFGQRKKSSGCDEYCLGKTPENRSMQTLLVRADDKNEGACICEDKKDAQISTASEAATQVSAKSSKQDLKKSKPDEDLLMTDKKSSRKFLSKVDKQDKETWSRENPMQDRDTETYSKIDNKNIEAKPSNVDKANRTSSTSKDDREKNKDREKVKDGVCNKCGRPKRDCLSPCRNTIIIPYASSSSRALPAGEVDSLRMLIKMQSRETSRQMDNIMTELNHQKSEVRRLNDMYQKMMESYYEMQSRSNSTQPSDLSRNCRCSIKRFDTAKECGCSVSNDCKILSKHDTPTGRNYDATASNNSRNTNNIQLKRFGPPNTAVAINRCDVCNVEVTGNSVRACLTPRENNYQDGDKQRKDQLNISKKAGKSKQNLSTRKDNIPSGGTGDSSLPKADSISTIFKKDKNRDDQIDKRNGHENLLDGNFDYIKESEAPDSAIKSDVNEIETDTDSNEPGKKTRSIYSSRVLVWLKKSWINIKHKAGDCRKREKKRREEQAWKCMFKYCEYKVKQAGTGIWKELTQHLTHTLNVQGESVANITSTAESTFTANISNPTAGYIA